MNALTLKEIGVVSGGWGALDQCTPKYGFDPKTQDCFDGGPVPKGGRKVSHGEMLPKSVLAS